MEYYQNKIAIPVAVLVPSVISRWSYKYIKTKDDELVLRRGCRNTPALIDYDRIPERFKLEIIKKIGDPKKIIKTDYFTSFIETDRIAIEFFSTYRKPNGKPLDKQKQLEYRTNAEILNAIPQFLNDIRALHRQKGNSTAGIWQRVVDDVNNLDVAKYPHSLPPTQRPLERKLCRYNNEGGYITIIHGGMGNINTTKIRGKVADWLLSTYCLPHKPVVPYLMEMYNECRFEKDFPELSESAVNIWLNKPEIKRQWVLARHGKDEYMRLYGHRMSRNRDNWFPNAWWAIDGTKLDWVHYYDNDLGMAAKLKIDPTFDVYSEKILGYSYSETENHTDNFISIKMSVKTSLSKPFLLTYDGQSGHTTGIMQILYDQVVATGGKHYKHQARRHGSPAEGLFNRFQQQVISRFWFSDKQSIKVKNIDNKPNIDFIIRNKHKLYTREDLIKAWKLAVKQWNNGEHPKYKGKTRNEVYSQPAPLRHKVDELEIIKMFWIYSSKGSTYNREGINITIAGNDYTFEVYTADDKVDLEFRRKYIGCKFIIKYDPETLDEFVGLYEKTDDGLLLISYAKPKRTHEQIPILMTDRDTALVFQDQQISDKEYQRDLKAVEALRARTGITEESLIEQQDLLIKMGGKLTKDQRNKVEADDFLSRI